ncbi:MAG: radical SAM protein [Nitrospirae bacterium]|nr:radical SAM protein [Nitrospirota bacterium]
MRYYLSSGSVLKLLETPSVYDIKNDELYELDDDAFEFLKKCSDVEGGSGKGADKEFIEYCLSKGILVKEPADVKRPLIIKSPVPSLRYLELQITDRCNLKCKHCYIGKPLNNELTVSEIKPVLNEFEKMQGLRLLITGGEPLMHSRFGEINSLLPEYNFRKILFTNGLLLTEKLLKWLNADEIQVSVDGMEHGHEAIRGKGTYGIVIRTIREAIDIGTTVSIATMIHRENLVEFDEMDRLFRKIGVKDWTVDAPCISGNLKDNLLFQVAPEVAGKYLNYGFGDGLHGGGEGFACGLHLMSVLANGDAAKCAFYSHMPVGNIKEGLMALWVKMKPIKLGELECFHASCQFMDACRGGCRFRAEDIHKRDLYRCHAYGIIK